MRDCGFIARRTDGTKPIGEVAVFDVKDLRPIERLTEMHGEVDGHRIGHTMASGEDLPGRNAEIDHGAEPVVSVETFGLVDQ